MGRGCRLTHGRHAGQPAHRLPGDAGRPLDVLPRSTSLRRWAGPALPAPCPRTHLHLWRENGHAIPGTDTDVVCQRTLPVWLAATVPATDHRRDRRRTAGTASHFPDTGRHLRSHHRGQPHALPRRRAVGQGAGTGAVWLRGQQRAFAERNQHRHAAGTVCTRGCEGCALARGTPQRRNGGGDALAHTDVGRRFERTGEQRHLAAGSRPARPRPVPARCRDRLDTPGTGRVHLARGGRHRTPEPGQP